jgi:ATP-dependent helicase/nuclease subunit A
METVRRLRHFVDFAGPPSDADRERLLRELASSAQTGVVLKRWGPKGSPEQALARQLRDHTLPALREQILKPLLTRWRQHVYSLAGELVDEAMVYYRAARMAAATLTFHDLLELTAALLRDRPDVRLALQRRYRRLYVDECQDTDPLQAEVLLYLTGADADERDWRRLAPLPGRLFLVGDEKQSIYRFRRADVDVYRLFRERVAEAGGQVVELTTSFRSRPPLTRWLNESFEPLFEGHDSRYQAEFRRLAAHQADADGSGVYQLRGRVDGTRGEQVGDEAERIASFIAAALRGDTPLNGADRVLRHTAEPGDFMVLTRTRRFLSTYGRALEQLGVPYDITGAGSLRASSELRGLVDALEAVLRPDDPVALAAYLRGLVVGLGDDELYRLRKAGWACRWNADPPDGVPAATRDRLARALSRLRDLRRDLHDRPPAAALERFVEATGLAAMAAGREAGSSRVGNLLRVLAMVRDWQSRRGLDWADITAALRDLLDEEELRVEEMTLETGRTDVVRIMNLHQAKGLEAKVVFLADPTDSSAQRHAVTTHVSRLGERPYLSMAVTRRGRYQPIMLAEPVGWAQDQEEEERFVAAEELRLVYVAATRARDALVVGVAAHQSKGPWASLSSALTHIPQLPAPAAAAPAAPAGRQPSLDLTQVQSRRRQALAAALEPSYVNMSVTDAEELDVVDADPETRGRGRRYGTAVHRLLESAVVGRLEALDEVGLGAYVERLLTAEGLPADDLREAGLTALRCFQASPLWQEMRRSDDVYAEVPYAEPTPDGVLRGVIDLVYRVGETNWKVVDYKTHRADIDGGPEPLDRLVNRYRDQVEAYAAQWEAVSGEGVVERGLWLAASDGTDRYIEI